MILAHSSKLLLKSSDYLCNNRDNQRRIQGGREGGSGIPHRHTTILPVKNTASHYSLLNLLTGYLDVGIITI